MYDEHEDQLCLLEVNIREMLVPDIVQPCRTRSRCPCRLPLKEGLCAYLLENLDEVLSLVGGYDELGQDDNVGVLIRAVLADQARHVALDLISHLLQDLNNTPSRDLATV